VAKAMPGTVLPLLDNANVGPPLLRPIEAPCGSGEPSESLDASPAPPHPLAVLSWDWGYTHGPLWHSKRVLAASCTLPRAG
jgi:hypothetical protein